MKKMTVEVVFEKGMRLHLRDVPALPLPGVTLRGECPHCRAPVAFDMGGQEHCLRRPVVNEPVSSDWLVCPMCEMLIDVDLVCDLTLRVAQDETKAEDALGEHRALLAVEHQARRVRIAQAGLSQALLDLDYSRGIDVEPDEILVGVLEEVIAIAGRPAPPGEAIDEIRALVTAALNRRPTGHPEAVDGKPVSRLDLAENALQAWRAHTLALAACKDPKEIHLLWEAAITATDAHQAHVDP